MKIVSENKSFEGVQGVYTHVSHETQCEMTFALFMPPRMERTKEEKSGKVPLLWYLSGLTCSHQNVMDKGEYRRMAAELGIAVICPDTSPRGVDVPDEKDNWQFGQGAGFYLDATQEPFAKNYRMYSYLLHELPALLTKEFPVLDLSRQSIFGHSMGGHGAITMALKNPDRFKSVSAFAPICHPVQAKWSKPAFEKYLGDNRVSWRAYDAVELIEDGHRFCEILVDQGMADEFLEGLQPHTLQEACAKADIQLIFNRREGYNHSYYFVSTFMDDHLKYHARALNVL